MQEVQVWLQGTHGVTHAETTAFFQGHTVRWAVAWTFVPAVLPALLFSPVHMNAQVADTPETRTLCLPEPPAGAPEVTNAAVYTFGVSNTADVKEVWGRIAVATGFSQGSAALHSRLGPSLQQNTAVTTEMKSRWIGETDSSVIMRIASNDYWHDAGASTTSGGKRTRDHAFSASVSLLALPASSPYVEVACAVHSSACGVEVQLYLVRPDSKSGLQFSRWAMGVKQNVQQTNRFWRRRTKLRGKGGLAIAPKAARSGD
jgi:hypothetical protein